MILSRRGLLGIGSAFLAAPAIVRVASIMPVSVVVAPVECSFAEIVARVLATVWADPTRDAIWKQLETANILREQRERANFARLAA